MSHQVVPNMGAKHMKKRGLLRRVAARLYWMWSVSNVPSVAQLWYRLRRDRLPGVSFRELTGLPAPQPVPSPILDHICMPPYYGDQAHDDFNTLLGILDTLDPKVVLELGTAHGNTVANICRRFPAAHVYTVNAPVEEQTGVVISFELSRNEIGRVYRDYQYNSRVTQIFANTLEMDLAPFFSDACVDAAIIDACHDTDYVINDFLKVERFIRPGGIVLLHDTHPSMKGHLFGSYRACLLLRKQEYNIRHLENTWWGVWIAPAVK